MCLANGLIAHVPSEQTYDLGGYEVDSSYHLFIRQPLYSRRGIPDSKTVDPIIPNTALVSLLSV